MSRCHGYRRPGCALVSRAGHMPSITGRVGQHCRQIATILMPELVTRGAKRDQIVKFVGASLRARQDVVQVHVPRVLAPFATALMAVAR